MTFSDLPANWLTRPLTDPVLAANAVDLFVTAGERRHGVLAALICDGRARFRTSILLDLPREAPLASPRSCVRALAPLVPVLQGRPDGALILALGRPEPDPPADHDWTQAAIQTCQTASIRLLAFYVATPTDLHAVPLPAQPHPPNPTHPPNPPRQPNPTRPPNPTHQPNPSSATWPIRSRPPSPPPLSGRPLSSAGPGVSGRLGGGTGC